MESWPSVATAAMVASTIVYWPKASVPRRLATARFTMSVLPWLNAAPSRLKPTPACILAVSGDDPHSQGHRGPFTRSIDELTEPQFEPDECPEPMAPVAPPSHMIVHVALQQIRIEEIAPTRPVVKERASDQLQ